MEMSVTRPAQMMLTLYYNKEQFKHRFHMETLNKSRNTDFIDTLYRYVQTITIYNYIMDVTFKYMHYKQNKGHFVKISIWFPIYDCDALIEWKLKWESFRNDCPYLLPAKCAQWSTGIWNFTLNEKGIPTILFNSTSWGIIYFLLCSTHVF